MVFADVAGSTALGERVDPETLRWAMQRWFGRMGDVIERHGGTVENFIGAARRASPDVARPRCRRGTAGEVRRASSTARFEPFTTLEAQEADAVASVMTAPPVGFEMLTFRLLRTCAALLPLKANRIE